MNAHYQYFLATGQTVAARRTVISETPITPIATVLPTAVQPTATTTTTVVSTPTTTTTASPTTSPITTNTTIPLDPSLAQLAQPVAQPASVINVFGTGLSGSIATSPIQDALLLPQSTAIDTSAGGGGGGFMPSEEDNGEQAILPFGKTIIPLAVIAIGVAVLILKPIK